MLLRSSQKPVESNLSQTFPPLTQYMSLVNEDAFWSRMLFAVSCPRTAINPSKRKHALKSYQMQSPARQHSQVYRHPQTQSPCEIFSKDLEKSSRKIKCPPKWQGRETLPIGFILQWFNGQREERPRLAVSFPALSMTISVIQHL